MKAPSWAYWLIGAQAVVLMHLADWRGATFLSVAWAAVAFIYFAAYIITSFREK